MQNRDGDTLDGKGPRRIVPRARTASMIVCVLASASVATAQALPPVPSTQVGIFQAGVAKVQQMSADPLQRQALMAAQLQPTTLKTDRKTTIIVISVIAAAAVIYTLYQFEHSSSGITIH